MNPTPAWKWAHEVASSDADHKPARKASSFGLDVCRHCGGYLKKVAR
jgi:hypothetical protein